MKKSHTIIVFFSLSLYVLHPAVASDFLGLKEFKKAIGSIEKIQSRVRVVEAEQVGILSAEQEVVQNAPAEVIASRTLSDLNQNDIDQEYVLAHTSPLDVEPGVLNWNDTLREFNKARNDGVGPPDNSRVYKGQMVNDGFKRIVALLDADGNFLCTGTIISPTHILTAAHCLCDGAHAKKDRLKWAVYGSHIPTGAPMELDPLKTDWMGAASICFDNFTDPDIAIVGFTVAVGAGLPQLKLSQLADDVTIDATKTLRVVGYGPDGTSGPAGVKRTAVVPVVSARCKGESTSNTGVQLSAQFECVEDREILAGRVGDPDTCKGDSGGPALVTQIDDEADLFASDIPVDAILIAGITSRGIRAPVGSFLPDCGYGGIYVRVTGQVKIWLARYFDNGIARQNADLRLSGM